MDSMIRETNENLKAIIDTMKNNLDASIETLNNIQMQMDKKVEEAKKYKIQVDEAKEKINLLESENKDLEMSLAELQEKYSKMNLLSVIEAGNKEIKAKINENLISISKEKEHIAELTNKARTIKDLLINLKKDKTIKEERLENIKISYEYYNERLTEIIDYATNNSNNLSDYKAPIIDSFKEQDSKNLNGEIENTLIFDEIANIDGNKNFKDEMTFINNQIDENINNEVKDENTENEIDTNTDSLENPFLNDTNETEDTSETSNDDTNFDFDFDMGNLSDNSSTDNNTSNEDLNNSEISDMDINQINDKIDDLFTTVNSIPETEDKKETLNIEQKIDNAYNEVFGQPLENNEIKKDPTMTDIFGNPIKEETINKANEKQIEEMFTVNGINLKQFKEEDQNYLKQNYNEQNYQNIINTLNRNNINLDNVYYAPNIFVEMTDSELENILNKLIGAGQSLEAIGLILEKFPRIKNYNLDQAIMNYGEYIKDIDITELIMKAKELSNGGN